MILNAFFIGFGWWLYSGYLNYSSHLNSVVEQQLPLLVLQLQQSALAFTWVPIVPILIVLNTEIIIARILQKRIPTVIKRSQKASMWVLFLGTALLVFGNQIINPVWGKTFTEAGYSRCHTWIITGSRAIFNQAWVLDATDCHDPVLKDILNDAWGELKIEEGRRYLEEKHRFLERYNTSQSVP